jgi:hypothetical protein
MDISNEHKNEIPNEIHDREIDDLLELINEYKNEEEKYELFYKEPVENLKVNFIYIGTNNEIQCINETSVLLTNNALNKERLLQLITKNKIKNSVKYTLKYLLKYNIILEPCNIIPYLKNKISDKFLTEIKVIDEIKFLDTISVMEDLNCLLFIYTEKSLETTGSIFKSIHDDKYKRTKKLLDRIRRRKTKRIV